MTDSATVAVPSIRDSDQNSTQEAEELQSVPYGQAIIHWNMVKRIIKYLKGSMNLAIHFKADEEMILKGFSDADYAADTTTINKWLHLSFGKSSNNILFHFQLQKLST
ncbi:hypothetical protein JTB14_010417 [Gonioctena quinquepunctata]|nr:hypothetical protein JTB14_010417 [Gonioctena quinquepunctata]